MPVEFRLQSTELKPESDIIVFVRSPQKSRTRKLVFAIHRWVGALVALYIILMSLTGVSLVFHDELSEWLNPSFRVSVTAGKVSRLNPSRIIENVESHFAGYKVTGLIARHDRDLPVDVFASGKDAERLTCQVDPYSGKVLGLKGESPILRFLRDLHFNMLNGKTGRTVNGIGAICLLIVALTGLAVWWRGIANWLNGFRLSLSGGLRKANWNLHTTLGAWVFPFILLQSLSGFYFGFPVFFEENLNKFAPVSARKALPASVSARSPDVDEMVATARSAIEDGDAFVERIAFPDKKRNSVRIWLSSAANPNSVEFFKTQVFIHPETGSVLAVSNGARPPLGDAIIQSLLRFHFGTLAGSASKWLWIFVGLTPSVLGFTGLYLFIRGLANRKR